MNCPTDEFFFDQLSLLWIIRAWFSVMNFSKSHHVRNNLQLRVPFSVPIFGKIILSRKLIQQENASNLNEINMKMQDPSLRSIFNQIRNCMILTNFFTFLLKFVVSSPHSVVRDSRIATAILTILLTVFNVIDLILSYSTNFAEILHATSYDCLSSSKINKKLNRLFLKPCSMARLITQFETNEKCSQCFTHLGGGMDSWLSRAHDIPVLALLKRSKNLCVSHGFI